MISKNTINPIDYYNKNCMHDILDKMTKLKNWELHGDSLNYVVNRVDKQKRMFVIDKKHKIFKVECENDLDLPIGETYTPFQFLQKFIYKNNFDYAFSYVYYDIMGNITDYLRIGINYNKVFYKTDRFGIKRTTRQIWNKSTIIDDHGKKFIEKIPKYNDYTIYPDNKEFKQVYGGNYNVYAPFEHKPCEKEDYTGEEQFVWTKKLLSHIFGEQYDKGLKYMKALYDIPRHPLPILVLISEERQTGKTTFVDYLTILFGDNTVIINPQDIGGSFNAPYADKNIIMIEESHFDSRQSLEKLKNLSTQKTILVNSKFIQQYQLPFYGKIIITSNDENKFSKVDDEEIRYWVRKIPTLTGKANHSILEDLRQEIPYFLYYLNTLPPLDVSRSRMLFEPHEIETDSLTAVKLESRSELHKEIEMYMENHCLQNPKIKEFYFTGIDLKDIFFQNHHNFKSAYIHRTLKQGLKLEKIETTTRYIPLESQLSGFAAEKKVGKPFIYPNPYYDEFGENDIEDINSEQKGIMFNQKDENGVPF